MRISVGDGETLSTAGCELFKTFRFGLSLSLSLSLSLTHTHTHTHKNRGKILVM